MAASAVTRGDQSTLSRPTLFLACALRTSTGKRGCTTGAAPRPRDRPVPARHLAAVQEEMPRAQQRFGLPDVRQAWRAAPRRRWQPEGESQPGSD